jgi:PAS domain S-box-containing protein
MQYTVFLILAPMTAIILLATAGVILRGPQSRLSSILLASLVCSLGFIITNTLELVLPTETGTMLFAKLGYPFSSFTPVFVLFFTLAFTGNDGWLAGKRRILAFLVPFTVSVLAAFEPLHGLIWSRITYLPVGGMLAMRVTYGWFFWIGFSYSFSLLVFSAVLMLRETVHAQPVYRWQSLLMVTGIAIPLVLYVVYSLKLVPGLTKNFSPIAYGAAGLCFVASIRQHRFLDLIPIGRSLLVDEIPDAMIVVDVSGRIVDVNSAGAALLGESPTIIGTDIARYPELERTFAQESPATAPEELSFLVRGVVRYFGARVSLIRDKRGAVIGSIVLLRDVTDAHVHLEEKNRLIEELTRAAAEIKTLQGIIPICMYCKKIRDDEGYWHQVEQFVSDHSSAQFSHGLCPECRKKLEENDFRMTP